MEGVRRSLEDGKGDRALTKLHGELFRLFYSPLAGTNSLIGGLSRDEAKERTAAAWTSMSMFSSSVRLWTRVSPGKLPTNNKLRVKLRQNRKFRRITLNVFRHAVIDPKRQFLERHSVVIAIIDPNLEQHASSAAFPAATAAGRSVSLVSKFLAQDTKSAYVYDGGVVDSRSLNPAGRRH
ncbi:hypothetical protein ALC57_11175 [Trachymyrmex cornetzi]|uniref:Uncharacterized protein n=1 Tax=Trachymyrmex cornetzi TaxID=471704 RepID=A0A195DV05_9HYME|nr:hypothetical protein ALC57_11175 [Trachymyrmex cornetzi]